MITCPKCGTENPDGFRNCRECYHPFGLEGVTGQQPPIASINSHAGYGEMAPPPDGYGAAPPPRGPDSGPPPREPAPPPDRTTPRSPNGVRILSAKPVRKVHPAAWIAIAASVLVIIFVLAYFLTRGGGGSDSGVDKAFATMDELRGWEAQARMDSDTYGMDNLSIELGQIWEGELAYEGPGRFSFSATSADEDSFMTDIYAMRIIDDQLYEKLGSRGRWANLGPVPEDKRALNPIWNTAFTDKLSYKEEKEHQEVAGIDCKVYSFDQDIQITIESPVMDFNLPYHYAGKVYVDSANNYVVSIDYIVELEQLGRAHYRYDFSSWDDLVSVELPPGV